MATGGAARGGGAAGREHLRAPGTRADAGTEANEGEGQSVTNCELEGGDGIAEADRCSCMFKPSSSPASKSAKWALPPSSLPKLRPHLTPSDQSQLICRSITGMHLLPFAHTCPPGTGGPFFGSARGISSCGFLSVASSSGMAVNQFRALCWMSRLAGLPVLAQTLQSSVCKGFLTSTGPRQHAEAIPFPVSFVVWLERRVCASHTSDAEVYQLGCLLCMVWASLR